MTPKQIAKLFQEWGGLIPHFGIEIDASQNNLPCSMTIDGQKTSAPHLAHGGSIMTLMDTALGMMSLKTSFEGGLSASTVEMKVNFLSPVHIGETIVATSELISHGKTLLVISGRAVEQKSGRDVAYAVGTFNMYELASNSELTKYLETTPLKKSRAT